MPSTIAPTIGRKVWFYTGLHDSMPPLSPSQAYDATVIFVHPDGLVNLDCVDHEGNSFVAKLVPLRDPDTADAHGRNDEAFATWMPYQIEPTKIRTVSASAPSPSLAP